MKNGMYRSYRPVSVSFRSAVSSRAYSASSAAPRARVRRRVVVHEGAAVVAGALVRVGEPRMDVRGVGRARLPREELLATVDDRLVRDRVVAPGLPGARRDADHVEDADRLGGLHAGGAELGGVVDCRPAIHPAAEEDVAHDVAAMATLGLVDRRDAVEVRAREQARDVPADR